MGNAARGHVALRSLNYGSRQLSAKFFIAMPGKVGAEIFLGLAIAQVGAQQALERLRHQGCRATVANGTRGARMLADSAADAEVVRRR